MTRNQTNDRPDFREQNALRRFAAVTFVKHLTLSGTPLAEALRHAALRAWPEEPNGRIYAARTIEDWWYAYEKGGFAALRTRQRADNGVRRTLLPAQQEWLLKQRVTHPGIPLKVLYPRWKKSDPDLPSLSVIYRFFRSEGLDTASLKRGVLEHGPNKAFEAPFPNDLWMADFSPGPKIRTEEGEVLSTHLCLIVDDHSRLIPFAAYYLRAHTESFHHGFKEAVARRGIPQKLYTDNGAPFVSHHTKIVCANLGVRLLHHKPYAAWSTGKVERLFHTVQRGFESLLALPEERVASLEELNKKLWAWIQGTYHQRRHEATGMTPQARFLAGVPEQAQYELDLGPLGLDRLFYTRAERTVRKNGTVRLESRLFEVDLSLRGRVVELRYDPFGDLRSLEVYHQGAFAGSATPVDLHLNSQIHHDSQNYERGEQSTGC